jgi:hypothetical protein
VSNERAEKWLRNLGYRPEPDPTWITHGKKPDFFCAGDPPVWVEVKTLDPPPELQRLDRSFQSLRSRCEALVGVTGNLYVTVGASLDGRAERWLVGDLEHRHMTEDVEIVVAVPGDADYASSIRFDYEHREGSIRQISVAAASDRYPFYPSLEPARWSDKVTITKADGQRDSRQLYDLLLDAVEPALIAWVLPSDSPLTVHGVGNTGMYGNRTPERIREQVKESNAQLKNGQSQRPGPGVCVIYHETLDHASARQLVAALLGDIAIPIQSDGRSLGQARFTRNGVWRPTKNRAVSAVRYVRTDDSITTVINPWARYAINFDLFREPVLMLEGSRMVERRWP